MAGVRKKCYLHIGTEKTGTTTLQAFLDLNRTLLREQGIVFTKAAGKQNNRLLAIAAFDPGRRDNATAARQVRTDADLQKLQAEVVLELREEISASNCTVGIFSSEHFHSRLTDDSEIARLRQILETLGFDDIYVVVYLRRPADIAASLYSTAVRAGSQMEEPPPPSHPYWNLICHHQNTLTRWGSVFGRERLLPRLFARGDLVGGHIVYDFLDVIGLASAAMEVPADRNESLSADGLALLKLLNARVPNTRDGQINRVRGDIASYVGRHFSEPKYRMPKALVHSYENAFAASDEWVRANFFPQRERLFSGAAVVDSAGEQPSLKAAELERIAAMVAEIWTAKQERVIALQERLQALRASKARS